MNVDNLSIQYLSGIVFENFSARFKDSQISMILGASGCGKTSLLHAIAEDLGTVGPVSFVFQEPRLLPWVSIRKNLSLPLIGAGYSEREAASRVHEYLGLVGLEKRAEDRPGALSGGERQRASIARAFAMPSEVLLMDEPFQSQDTVTKKQLMTLVKRLQEHEKRTILAVTHSLSEAEDLGDELVLLGGKPASILFQGTNNSLNRRTLVSLIGQGERFV